jgi:hypothetical protein
VEVQDLGPGRPLQVDDELLAEGDPCAPVRVELDRADAKPLAELAQHLVRRHGHPASL